MRFRFSLILLLFVLSACANKMRPAGKFYETFSVPDHVLKLAPPQLGHVSTSYSTENSAANPTHHRQAFEMTFDLKEDPAHPLNDEVLIANIMTSIQSGLEDTGFRSRGRGREGNSIHFDYEGRDRDRHYGSVDLHFVRAESQQYKIFGTIREAVIDK